MSERDLRERLRRQTGRAMAESVRKQELLEQDPLQDLRAGDVFIFGDDEGSPVEWVVLEPSTETGRWIVVPADTNPMVGSRDLKLDDPSAGPLVLRLALATVMDAGVFEPAMRRGLLGPESLDLARRGFRRVESGEARGSVRQREMEADPAYEDWIRDYVEPARQTLAGAAVGEGTEKKVLAFPPKPATEFRESVGRMVPARWVHALAAVFALVTLGLASWIVNQQRQIALLSRPSFNLPIFEIRLNDVERSAEPISVPGDATDLLLYLSLEETEPCESYALDLLGRAGREVWTQTLKEWPIDDVNLRLPGTVLEQSPLTLQLHGICDGKRKLLDERELRITLDG